MWGGLHTIYILLVNAWEYGSFPPMAKILMIKSHEFNGIMEYIFEEFKTSQKIFVLSAMHITDYIPKYNVSAS